MKAKDFEDAARQACETNINDARNSYSRVDEGNLPYLCLDLVYQYTLLVDGFGKFEIIVEIRKFRSFYSNFSL